MVGKTLVGMFAFDSLGFRCLVESRVVAGAVATAITFSFGEFDVSDGVGAINRWNSKASSGFFAVLDHERCDCLACVD